MSESAISEADFAKALIDIRNEIRTTQVRTMRQANKNLIMMYFRIGKILFGNSLNDSHFIKDVSVNLKIEFPNLKGFSRRNLYNMYAFYIEYKDDKTVQQLVAQISWGHNLLLMSKIKDIELRKFYIEATIENGWSRNLLDWQIRCNLDSIGDCMHHFSYRFDLHEYSILY
jgi:predicted nuclease of restriction endonuclease-like (RecB) superfamily